MAKGKKEEVQPEDEQSGGEKQPEEAQPTPTGEEQPSLSDAERAEQYLANWQRTQADFANYKKRAEQEKAEFSRFANASLMNSILPVIDDFERALENAPEEGNSEWMEGIKLIYRKLMGVLEGQGLSKIEAEGKDFDPNFHQAVLHEEGEEGRVLQELQKGYMIHDRLLRPAMVTVGKGKSEETDGGEVDTEQNDS
ncbi:MAG: nucleotide exchange factor GrpE [Dehalococcoidia bacterium]